MTRDEILDAVAGELHRIAPEADLAGVDPSADLREALDLDSMDMLNLFIALDRRLGIAIPEADYARAATLGGLVDTLLTRSPARPAPG